VPDDEDNLIETRKAGCAMKLFQDVRKWDKEHGQKLWEETGIIEHLTEMCGTDIKAVLGDRQDYNLGDAVKDVTDAIQFDDVEHFPPLPGWTFEKLQNYTKIANTQLLGRLYSTPEQKVYMNGALPDMMLQNFALAMQGKTLKFWAYHGHREMSYALAQLLGLDYSFLDRRGIPATAIPPATSVFLELHREGEQFFIQVWVWSPCIKNAETGEEVHATMDDDPKIDCPAVLVNLQGCPNTSCHYEVFSRIITDQIAKTGTWQKLCGLTPTAQFMISSVNSFKPTSIYQVIIIFCLVSVGITLCFILNTKRRKRFEYTSIPEGSIFDDI